MKAPHRSVAVRLAAIAAIAVPVAFHAQQAKATEHPKVCAAGVRDYSSRAELPAVFDTLTLPPSEPVQVTSREEADASQARMREAAGNVGATGLLTEEVMEEVPNGMRMSRSVTPIFAPSDTARAYAACRKGGA